MIREWLSALPSRFLDALYPPKCVCCGKILERKGTVLCRTCFEPYEEAKARKCGRCFQSRSRCVCSRRVLESARVSRLVKLCSYRPHMIDAPENRLIFSLKHDHRADVSRFLANQLSYALASGVRNIGSFSIVHAPRSSRSIMRDGYDHSEMLAAEIAKMFRIPHLDAIKRKRGGKHQHKLSLSARKANADFHLYLNPKAAIAGKRLLLLDDITTSGATLARCARLLYEAGAKEVVGVVIAVAGRDSSDKPRRYSVKMRSMR